MGTRLPVFSYLPVFFLFSVVGLGQQISPRPLITQPLVESQLTTLKGNTHPLAQAQFDVGGAPPDLPMNRMLLVLKRSPEQEHSLHTLLDNQQDKASPHYHKWLTPDEFGAQFGPTDQDLQVVTGWLQSHGFALNRVTNGRSVVEFSGTEAQVEEALHTSIHKYAVNGEEHWANANDPQIPSALAPIVAGVQALNNFPATRYSHIAGVVSREKSSGQLTSPKPLFTLPSNGCGVQRSDCFGVGPYDFATIYNVAPAWNASPAIDGTGQTIAIVGETDINPQDVTDFRNFFGLPAYGQSGGPSLNIIHDGPAPGILTDGEETEADLDVEWSGAVAKGASVDFVVSESTETTAGVHLSALYIVDNDLAPVMSESYGTCELFLGNAGNQFFNALWQQAAAEGITVMISSGDGGSAGCDNFDAGGPAKRGLEVSGYASTPYNVAVGGTDFNDLTNASTYWSTTNDSTTHASALSYIPETTWDDNCTNPVFGALLGFSKDAETNCNNAQLINVGFVNIVSGSGGKSSCISSDGQTLSSCGGGYPKPSWQNAPGVPADGVRDVPDISLFAASGSPSGSFYVVCEADAVAPGESCNPNNFAVEFLAVGGTSASSPAFAGVMALVNQTQSRQGNANFVLYKLAQQHPSTFHDITTGTIAVPCQSGSPNCTVSHPGDRFGILAGYNARAGYDLATGIGSVDVDSLLSNWTSAQFTATTTTLNLSPTSSLTHGQSVAVTGSVAPTSGSGIPTGDVSLITSTGLGVDGFALGDGAISGNTNLLPGGTYTVTAHYAGDPTFGGSDSPPVSITVGKENSKTLVNLVILDNNGTPTSFSASNATYGSGFSLLRVDVGDSAATVSPSTGISSTCSNGVASCPTGKIALTSNGSPLAGGSFPLNIAGYTEDQSLSAGSYAISATYPGDSSYGPSSGATTFTIDKAPTTAVANVLPLQVQYANSVEIGGGVLTNSNGVVPTGTFSFFVDGAAARIVNGGLVYEGFPGGASGSATLGATGSTVFLSVGNHSLSMQYSGDGNYAASTSPGSPVTVTQAQTFFTEFGASPNTANWQQGITLTATLFGSEFGGAPTGTMTFFDNGNPVSGNITYTPKPPGPNVGSALVANMTYTASSPGLHNITVSYSGDSNYTSATSGPGATLTVGGPFSINPAGNIIVSSPGQPASTTLTISPNGGFSGTVTLTCAPDPNAKESTCNFANGSSTSSSVQVTINGSSPTATLNVTTTAPHPSARNMLPLGSSSGLVIAGLLMLPFTGQRRRMLLAFIGVITLLAFVGCGGGGAGGGGGGVTTDPGTGAGSYNFTVTGTTGGSGSAVISVTSSVVVSVQ